MPRKPKAKPEMPEEAELWNGIAKGVSLDVKDMIEMHSKQLAEWIEESPTKNARLAIAVNIDHSDGQAVVTTSLRYAQAVKDGRTRMMDDPRQGTLLSPDELEEMRKAKPPSDVESEE